MVARLTVAVQAESMCMHFALFVPFFSSHPRLSLSPKAAEDNVSHPRTNGSHDEYGGTYMEQIQWNPSNPDTNGTEESAILVRCPHFKSFLREGSTVCS